MARKYDLISELYNRTCKTVVSNPQNWQAFLASASHTEREHTECCVFFFLVLKQEKIRQRYFDVD